eukprot:gene7303-9851_t
MVPWLTNQSVNDPAMEPLSLGVVVCTIIITMHHEPGSPMSQASHRKLSLRVTSALFAAAALLVAPSFISTASAQMMSYAPTSQDGLPNDPDDNVMVAPQ